MSSLVDNTNNDFIKSSQGFRKKREISVWVENEEDVPFWFSFFSELIPNIKFNITAPSTGERGKQSLIKHFGKEGADLLFCLDSDYDYTLQTDIGKKMQNSPYIFQTYVYAIENFRCVPKNLEKVVVQSTLQSMVDFDFNNFLLQYSNIVYPLFLQFLENRKSDDEKLKSIFEPMLKLEKDYSISSNLEEVVQRGLINGASQEFQNKTEVLGCVQSECYLFLRGHDMERKVLEVLNKLCGRIVGLNKQEIGENSTNPQQDLQAYQNKIRGVGDVFLDTDAYVFQKKSLFIGKALEFFEKIESDVVTYKTLLEA